MAKQKRSKVKSKALAEMIKQLREDNVLDHASNDLTQRSKFNFSYFDDTQDYGEKFMDLSQDELAKLFDDIKNFSRNSLLYWTSPTFVIYGIFPSHSRFVYPKHIPSDVCWARFRLSSFKRLVGFIVPELHHQTLHSHTREYYDKNTFYVVFFDSNHDFYPSESR